MRLERIFGKVSSRPTEQNPEPVEQFMSWFDRHPDRLEHEHRMLLESGITPEFKHLPDGRVAAIWDHDGKQVVMICSYHHPIEPPAIMIYGEGASSRLAGDGRLDIFDGGEFVWDPNTTLADIARHIAPLLDISEDPSADGDQEHEASNHSAELEHTNGQQKDEPSGDVAVLSN